jgi:hypothetical protein
MSKMRRLVLSIGAMAAAALAMPGTARAVDFYFENNQTANDARGVTHGAHDWLYMGPRQERSATINYGRGKYYYDANMTENRDGGEVYCKWHIEIDQRDNQVFCTILRKDTYTTRPCKGEIAHGGGRCFFTFGVADAP